MTGQGWLQIAIYVAVLTALTPVIGGYMARVFRGERVLLTPGAAAGRAAHLPADPRRPERQQDWKSYARTTIVFSALFWGALYLILRTQGIHPFNPEDFDSGTWDVTFNTASSFISNTNWQYYGGETTMTYFSQMAGLAVQNFVSAAVGIAVCDRRDPRLRLPLRLVARQLLAGPDRARCSTCSCRSPSSGALFLVSQGVIQNLSPYVTYGTLAGGEQTLALGPVASQEAIKQLGTNGGGFFNVNSAMPFENPSGISNFFEMLIDPADPRGADVASSGASSGNRRQGWALYSRHARPVRRARSRSSTLAEANGSPAQHLAGVAGDRRQPRGQGGPLRDRRLGAAGPPITTVASCGAVNAAFDSLTGIGGLVPMFNMSTGEVVFGGVGSGLYGMLLFVLLAVFIAGLMVGRTPEYLGKKIEAREVKLVMIGTLFVPLLALIATALAISTKWGAPSIYNPGPQGFSETLYAYISQAEQQRLGVRRLHRLRAAQRARQRGRVRHHLRGPAGRRSRCCSAASRRCVAALAVAGAAGAQARVAPLGPGTFRTDTPTFVVLLIATIVIVAALTFFPAFLLGPIVQGLTAQLF